MESRGATADLPDGKERFVLGRAGRQRRGEFADAEERHLRELARTETLEGPLLRRILESPVKSLDVSDFWRHPIEDGDLRQIGIFGGRILALAGSTFLTADVLMVLKLRRGAPDHLDDARHSDIAVANIDAAAAANASHGEFALDEIVRQFAEKPAVAAVMHGLARIVATRHAGKTAQGAGIPDAHPLDFVRHCSAGR